MSVKLLVKVEHCLNRDSAFDGQNISRTDHDAIKMFVIYIMLVFDGHCDSTCKQTLTTRLVWQWLFSVV